MQVVNQIVDELTEDCINQIKRGFENKSDDERQNEKLLWGGHIIFNPPAKWIPPDTSFLTDLNQQNNIRETFSMVYNKPNEKDEAPEKEIVCMLYAINLLYLIFLLIDFILYLIR